MNDRQKTLDAYVNIQNYHKAERYYCMYCHLKFFSYEKRKECPVCDKQVIINMSKMTMLPKTLRWLREKQFRLKEFITTDEEEKN